MTTIIGWIAFFQLVLMVIALTCYFLSQIAKAVLVKQGDLTTLLKGYLEKKTRFSEWVSRAIRLTLIICSFTMQLHWLAVGCIVGELFLYIVLNIIDHNNPLMNDKETLEKFAATKEYV